MFACSLPRRSSNVFPRLPKTSVLKVFTATTDLVFLRDLNKQNRSTFNGQPEAFFYILPILEGFGEI